MKFLSVLLIACMLLLSLTGMVKPAAITADKDCCKHMAGMNGKSVCHKSKSSNESKGCDKQGCAMMLSCSICGFLAVEPIYLQPGVIHYLPKPVPLHKIGDLSAYYPSDWKPPKVG